MELADWIVLIAYGGYGSVLVGLWIWLDRGLKKGEGEEPKMNGKKETNERKPDWATIVTEGTKDPHAEFHREDDLCKKLATVQFSWESTPPTKEFSIMRGDGELVYVASYPEGLVLRLNDDNNQRVFLTYAMLAELRCVSEGNA